MVRSGAWQPVSRIASTVPIAMHSSTHASGTAQRGIMAAWSWLGALIDVRVGRGSGHIFYFFSNDFNNGCRSRGPPVTCSSKFHAVSWCIIFFNRLRGLLLFVVSACFYRLHPISH